MQGGNGGQLKSSAVVLSREDGGLDQAGSFESGEKWLESIFTSKIKLIGLLRNWKKGFEGKTRVKGDFLGVLLEQLGEWWCDFLSGEDVE